MALPPFLGAIIGWLRAGYPAGVPDTDYLPLFALLGSHLTDKEVQEIADELALTGDADSAEAMRQAIRRATAEKPGENDIARVRARLAAGGWPLSSPNRI